MAEITSPLTVYIPDTRGVVVSPFGKGNLKIGETVYTYSRNPGLPGKIALGWFNEEQVIEKSHASIEGTCPGASEECRKICYARRPVAEGGAVKNMWAQNSVSDDVPSIPAEAELLRLHVSGDFSTVAYIENWITRLTERPDVRAWGYTRSWRIPELLPALERLRALPNVQLFASMDQSIPEVPPVGWRRAWIDGDTRAGQPWEQKAHSLEALRTDTVNPFIMVNQRNIETYDGTMTLVCPEETKHVPNCAKCKYCILGEKNDVTFLRH